MSSLFKLLAANAARLGDRTALSGNGIQVSWRELPVAIAERARLLREYGARVAALCADNSPDWIIWNLACLKNETICVPIPAFHTAEQRAHALQASGANVIIGKDGIAAHEVAQPALLPPGTAVITFTSGSTGTPKGVCLTLEGLQAVALGLVDAIGAEYAVRHFCILPLAVLLENVAGVFSTLIAGGECRIERLETIGFGNPFAPDFALLAQSLGAAEATSCILAPELLRGLMAQGPAAPSLKFAAVGGAKTDPGLLIAARQMGLPVYEGYGLSECGSVVSLNVPGADRLGSVGRPLRHQHLRAGGDNGIIVIDPPAFAGYAGGDGDERIFHTGDAGYIDRDGFLHVTGRLKNIIITSFGRNISPEWIESLLLSRPEIAQVLVYGEGLPRPRALIVPSRADAPVEAAIAIVNARLPEYAQVAKWHIVAPLTPAGGLLTQNGRLKREAILKHYGTLIMEETTDGFLRTARH